MKKWAIHLKYFSFASRYLASPFILKEGDFKEHVFTLHNSDILLKSEMTKNVLKSISQAQMKYFLEILCWLKHMWSMKSERRRNEEGNDVTHGNVHG